MSNFPSFNFPDATVPAPPPPSSTAAAQSELVTIEDMSDLYLLGNTDVTADDYNEDADAESLTPEKTRNGKTVGPVRKESVKFKDTVTEEKVDNVTEDGYHKETAVEESKEMQVTENGAEIVEGEDEGEDEKLQFLPGEGAGDGKVVGEVDVW